MFSADMAGGDGAARSPTVGLSMEYLVVEETHLCTGVPINPTIIAEPLAAQAGVGGTQCDRIEK